MNDRPFVPETSPLAADPENGGVSLISSCSKPENHSQYISLQDLHVQHLPEKWKSSQVLTDLKLVAKRVVHLTVVKLSSSRGHMKQQYGHTGSGFVAFHSRHGPIVHTSKHVVYDPFEAEHTIVRLFYDNDDNLAEAFRREGELRQLIQRSELESDPTSFTRSEHPTDTSNRRGNCLHMYRGSKRYFQSVLCSDYTAFSCEGLPVKELFQQAELEMSNVAFSWWKFTLKRLTLSPQVNIDVAIISHPHGQPKVISFGKMYRPYSVCPSLYDAPTCQGSSGSPVIRLHADSVHYISAGQFIHHGHWQKKLDMGMGMVRPPVALPYRKQLDTETKLVTAISLLYEPVLYWTLVVYDFLHIESTLKSSLDVFAYTSSFCALFFSVNSPYFKFLNCGFWLHILLTFIWWTKQAGVCYAACQTCATCISFAMFLVAWLLMHFLPWTGLSMATVIVLWVLVLYVERHFYLNNRFQRRFIGSFPEQILVKLSLDLNHQVKEMKKEDLVSTQKKLLCESSYKILPTI